MYEMIPIKSWLNYIQFASGGHANSNYTYIYSINRTDDPYTEWPCSPHQKYIFILVHIGRGPAKDGPH